MTQAPTSSRHASMAGSRPRWTDGPLARVADHRKRLRAIVVRTAANVHAWDAGLRLGAIIVRNRPDAQGGYARRRLRAIVIGAAAGEDPAPHAAELGIDRPAAPFSATRCAEQGQRRQDGKNQGEDEMTRGIGHGQFPVEMRSSVVFRRIGNLGTLAAFQASRAAQLAHAARSARKAPRLRQAGRRCVTPAADRSRRERPCGLRSSAAGDRPSTG